MHGLLTKKRRRWSPKLNSAYAFCCPLTEHATIWAQLTNCPIRHKVGFAQLGCPALHCEGFFITYSYSNSGSDFAFFCGRDLYRALMLGRVTGKRSG